MILCGDPDSGAQNKKGRSETGGPFLRCDVVLNYGDLAEQRSSLSSDMICRSIRSVKAISALCILTIGSAAAAQTAAWDAAPRYICRADQMRSCAAEDAACAKKDGLAIFVLDFQAGTFKPFASEDRFAETIVFKRYKQYGMGDVHVVMFDGGARMLQFIGQLRTEYTQRVIHAIFVSAYGDEVITHYLSCSPTL